MNFKNFVKLLSVAMLVAGYQVNAVEQQNNKENVANQMNQVNHIDAYKNSIANIYNNFLTEIGKTQNDEVDFNNDKISTLLQGYSEYLLPKIAYYTQQFVNLHKSGNNNVTISQICASLTKTLAKISNGTKSANNITYKEFFDTYINDNDILSLLEQYFSSINNNDISDKTEYEQLAYEIIHKQQDTNLLTGLLYKIYKGNFLLLSSHLSNANSLMDVNNNGVILFKGLANDLANADSDQSARTVLTVYINLINTILQNKDLQDQCSIF